MTNRTNKKESYKHEMNNILRVAFVQPLMGVLYGVKRNGYGVSVMFNFVLILGTMLTLRGWVFDKWTWAIIVINFAIEAFRRVVIYTGSCSLNFPIPRKCFTRTNEIGEIEMNEEDLEEMLVYLADVENYLKRNGKLK